MTRPLIRAPGASRTTARMPDVPLAAVEARVRLKNPAPAGSSLTFLSKIGDSLSRRLLGAVANLSAATYDGM
jgi:hypothetical protein